jgi:mannose-6-phosphate isomerase
VDDFGFDVLSATDEIKSQYLRSAEILFCIEGEVSVTSEEQVLTLKPGESVFVSNESMIYRYHGNGILGRAYN